MNFVTDIRTCDAILDYVTQPADVVHTDRKLFYKL